jgi:hypothetical protein
MSKTFTTNSTISISLVVILISFLLGNYIWAVNTFAEQKDICRVEGKVDALLSHFAIKYIEGRTGGNCK